MGFQVSFSTLLPVGKSATWRPEPVMTRGLHQGDVAWLKAPIQPQEGCLWNRYRGLGGAMRHSMTL
jgi:hypothetical protein